MASLALASVLLLAACGSGGGGSGSDDAGSAAPAPKGQVPSFISIGTAPTGASFYPMGVAIANIIQEKVGIQSNAEPTGASIENINLLVNGQAELGFALADTSVQAYNGEDVFKTPIKNLRVLMVGQTLPYILVVRKDSGIVQFSDIKGKRIAANLPRATSNKLAMVAALETHGMTWNDVQFRDINSLEESISLVKDGTLQGIWYPVAPGNAAYIDLGKSVATHWVSFDDGGVAKVLQKIPFFTPHTVPKAANQGQDQDIVTFGAAVEIVAMAELNEEIAYQITRAVMENLDKIVAAHPAGKEWTLQKSASVKGVPYHPGAIRYYQEKGVWKE